MIRPGKKLSAKQITLYYAWFNAYHDKENLSEDATVEEKNAALNAVISAAKLAKEFDVPGIKC